MSIKLGELLVKEDIISQEDLEKAIDSFKTHGGQLTSHIVTLGFMSDQALKDFLSKQYGIPAIDLEEFELEPSIVKLVPQDIAEKHVIIPVNKAGSSLIVAVSDPSNIMAIDDVKFVTGYNIEVVVATEASIKQALSEIYEKDEDFDYDDLMSGFDDTDVELVGDDDDIDVSDIAKSGAEAPVVKLVNFIMLDAIKKGASDIHIEPYEKNMRVRYRIDGILYETQNPPLKLKNALASRIKIMSELDIAERRLPQDGRIKLKLGRGKEIDFRVNCLPTIFGEKIVMRILDKGNLQVNMANLGFEEAALKDFKEAIHKPYGILLVTGPTGSGKTTTLYSALHELNKPETNISTAEDPVEYNLRGINQIQMHDDIGLNFASALRAFLRQDPDIIMVGEIRDFETAEIAIKASLTGHLVISTLHTNDAAGTIHRLLNMGIEPFMVASAILLIVAQRLVRKICEDCKKEVQVPNQTLINMGLPADQVGTFKIYKGSGCNYCSNTGYKGRIGLYEVMPIKEEITEFILNGASPSELRREAVRLGMITLRQAAIQKLVQGITTVEEVTRVSVD
ncbi:MAG: type IV-A pilus assembly ATPase PilB [Pseudomonadota bacterium]